MALQGPINLNPVNPFNIPAHRRAYQRALDLQAASLSRRISDDVTKARLLGYMLLEFNDLEARNTLAREMNACTDQTKLKGLAELYINHFIRCCKFLISC